MAIKVTVDHTLCQGHGQCQEAAPDLFELREDGLAYVIGEAGPESLGLARNAASRCPADAIRVEEQ